MRESNGRQKRIAEQRRGVKGQNFFITYGTSEFYTKPYEPGPASPEFQHIPLDRMNHLVESSLAALPQIRQSTDSVEWLRLMRIEKEKREKAQELLHSFRTVPYELTRYPWRERLPERSRRVFCSRASFSRFFETGRALGQVGVCR